MTFPRRVSLWRALAITAPLCVIYPLRASEHLPPLDPVVAQAPNTAPRWTNRTPARASTPAHETLKAFAQPVPGLVSGGRVNVRWGPGTQHGIVTVMNGGDALTATGRSDKWVEIEWPADACAWVSKYYCTSDGVITGEQVRIRARGRLDARILREANKGDRVTVLGEAGDWYKITAPAGARAYIYGKYTVLGGETARSTPVATATLPPISVQPAQTAPRTDDNLETSYTPVQDTRGLNFTERAAPAARTVPAPAAPARDTEREALAAATVFSAASAPLVSGADNEPAPTRVTTRTTTTVERVLAYTPETRPGQNGRPVELNVRPAARPFVAPPAPAVPDLPQAAPTQAQRPAVSEPVATAVTRAPVEATPDAKIESSLVAEPVNQAPVLQVEAPSAVQALPATPEPVKTAAPAQPNIVTTKPIEWSEPQPAGLRATDPMYGDILPPPKGTSVEYREPAEFQSAPQTKAPVEETGGDKDPAPKVTKQEEAPAPAPVKTPAAERKTDAQLYAEQQARDEGGEPVQREGGLINKTKKAFLSVGESLRGAPEMVSENVSGAWNNVAPTIGEPIKRGGRTVVRATNDAGTTVSTNTQKGYTTTKEFIVGKPVKKEAEDKPVLIEPVKADQQDQADAAEETPAILIIGPDGEARPLTTK